MLYVNYIWLTTILVIAGLLAIFGLLFELFSSVGRRPRKILATKQVSVDEDADEFLNAISGATNTAVQSHSQHPVILNNGDEFIPAILQAIKSARRSINFMVYVWERGEVSKLIFEALTERVKSGVEVRILFDGLGSFFAPSEEIRKFVEAGGIVGYFRPPHLGKIIRFFKRNHRRAIIIDGRLGFIGGAAIADKWLGNAEDPAHWRDVMFQLEGHLAVALQGAFAQIWADNEGEILVGERYYPDIHEEHRGVEEYLRFISLVSSPAHEVRPLHDFFWLSFFSARRKLYIANAYFLPTKNIADLLCTKAREGVDVRILMPSHHMDAKPVRWASQRYYQRLLEAGVRLYEYQPTMMHSKYLIVDDKWSIIGSANLDIRSLDLNKEAVFGLYDKEFAADLELVFLKDLIVSKEIKLEEWKKRPFWDRVLEQLSALFEEQF